MIFSDLCCFFQTTYIKYGLQGHLPSQPSIHTSSDGAQNPFNHQIYLQKFGYINRSRKVNGCHSLNWQLVIPTTKFHDISMILFISSKFHQFSMSAKWYLEFPGFPGLVGTLEVLLSLNHHYPLRSQDLVVPDPTPAPQCCSPNRGSQINPCWASWCSSSAIRWTDQSI